MYKNNRKLRLKHSLREQNVASLTYMLKNKYDMVWATLVAVLLSACAEFGDIAGALAAGAADGLTGTNTASTAYINSLSQRDPEVGQYARESAAQIGMVNASSARANGGFGGSSRQAIQPSSSSTGNANENAVINACSKNNAYLTWMNRCQSNPTAQAACYCSAAALIRCYMTAAPNSPSIGEWKKAYEENARQAAELGTKCFNN